MTVSRLEEARATPTRRFALVDESGRPEGIFSTSSEAWKVGDWILPRSGCCVRIAGISPPPPGEDVSGVWVVEPA